MTVETTAEREARRRKATAEPTWVGWVLRQSRGGYEWVRVELEASDVARCKRGHVEASDVRSVVGAKIENELNGDAFVERRPWKR